MVAQRPGHQLTRQRRCVGGVEVALVLDRAFQIHRLGHQVRRRDPVGERVVHLADHRESVIGHAFREIHLPQGAAAVQRRACDLADHLVELAAPAGPAHPHPAQVIGQVDVRLLQPHWVVKLQRDIDQPVPKRLQQVQPPSQGAPEHLEREVSVEVGGIDDADLQRVRMDVGRLAVQQHGVPAVEPFHAAPLWTTI